MILIIKNGIKNGINLEDGINPKIIIKKIDDKFYQLGQGPFTLKTRKEMLDRLLEVQSELNNGYELIKRDELVEIQKLWYEQGDLENSVHTIYKKYYVNDFELVKDDVQLLSDDDFEQLRELCITNDVNFKLFNELMDIEKSNFGY